MAFIIQGGTHCGYQEETTLSEFSRGVDLTGLFHAKGTK
jgi:hypothetical protein